MQMQLIMAKLQKRVEAKKYSDTPAQKALTFTVIFVFVCAAAVMYVSEPHGILLNTVHTGVNTSLPALGPNYNSGDIGWTTEPVSDTYVSGSLSDKLLRKRWDAFVFISFNYYIVEVVIADLGYASQIVITYSSFKDSDQIIAEYMLPVTLSDTLWKDEVHINTTYLQFDLTRKHTEKEYVTDIQFHGMWGNKTLIGNLTQFINKDQCMSFFRPYTSTKCLQGRSQGYVKKSWSHYNATYRFSQNFNDLWMFSNEVGTTMYDGFRGSGYEWYWIWSMGIGWTENIEKGYPRKADIRTVALSLGVMYGMEEDFFLVDGKLHKLQGVKYTLNQSNKWSLLKFTSENPKGQFEFNVTSSHHYKQNMIVVQKDMRKAYGVWKGQIELEGGLVEFDKVFGLVEISKSKF